MRVYSSHACSYFVNVLGGLDSCEGAARSVHHTKKVSAAKRASKCESDISPSPSHPTHAACAAINRSQLTGAICGCSANSRNRTHYRVSPKPGESSCQASLLSLRHAAGRE